MVRLTGFDVIKRPRMSSKAAQLNQLKKAKLVIDVHIKATKSDIKMAVESLFGVKVASVNTLIVGGKKRRSPRYIKAYQPDFKKAIITLKDEQEIEAFSKLSASMYNQEGSSV